MENSYIESQPGSFEVGRQALGIIYHLAHECTGECAAHRGGMPLSESFIAPKAVADAKRVASIYPNLRQGARDVVIKPLNEWEQTFGKK